MMVKGSMNAVLGVPRCLDEGRRPAPNASALDFSQRLGGA